MLARMVLWALTMMFCISGWGTKGWSRTSCSEMFKIVDSEDALRFLQNIHDKTPSRITCNYSEALKTLTSGLNSENKAKQRRVLISIRDHMPEILAYSKASPEDYRRLLSAFEDAAKKDGLASKDIYNPHK